MFSQHMQNCLWVFTCTEMKHIFLLKWKLSLSKFLKPDLMSGLLYHLCFLSRLNLPCAHIWAHTYMQASHTLKHSVADGPANASFPCRTPRATGCICVTEARPAATGGNGREMEKGEGKERGQWNIGDIRGGAKKGDSRRSEQGWRIVAEHRVAGRSSS